VLDWLAALDAGGGTEMVTGIDAALAVPHDPARLRIVVFLTDGYVGNEDEILRDVGRQMKEGRLFAFGVGTAVNRYLLEELAAIGRGTAQLVRPDEDSAAAVDTFERRIGRPVLTDLRIEWGGLAVTDLSPRAIPDLFAGQPLVLAGHYTAPGSGVVTVRGKQAGREVSFQVPVKLPVLDAARPAVAAVWARQRIAELSRRLVRAADPALQQEVLALSLEHRLLTPYTAFVAVDEARVTAGGAGKRVVVPVEVPDAVRGIEVRSGVGYGYGAGSGFGNYGYGSYGTSSRRAGIRIDSASLDNPFARADRDVVAEINASRTASTQMTAQPRRRVTFTIPVPTVEGGELDRTIIRRSVRRKEQQLTYCYEKELLGASPKLAGTLNATFTITDGGTAPGAIASGLGNAAVEACVAGVLSSLEFPRPQGGPVRVRYSFRLTSTENP
jgi:Ca-activated chloride channel family protein